MTTSSQTRPNNLELFRALKGKGRPHDFMASCPAHNDRNPSLHITTTRDGVVLLHCFAGCSQETVISALLDKGLWSGQSNDADGKPRRSLPSTITSRPMASLRIRLCASTQSPFDSGDPPPKADFGSGVSLPLNICAWDRRRIGCHSRKPDSPSGQQSASAGHSTQPRW